MQIKLNYGYLSIFLFVLALVVPVPIIHAAAVLCGAMFIIASAVVPVASLLEATFCLAVNKSLEYEPARLNESDRMFTAVFSVTAAMIDPWLAMGYLSLRFVEWLLHMFVFMRRT